MSDAEIEAGYACARARIFAFDGETPEYRRSVWDRLSEWRCAAEERTGARLPPPTVYLNFDRHFELEWKIRDRYLTLIFSEDIRPDRAIGLLCRLLGEKETPIHAV